MAHIVDALKVMDKQVRNWLEYVCKFDNDHHLFYSGIQCALAWKIILDQLPIADQSAWFVTNF